MIIHFYKSHRRPRKGGKKKERGKGERTFVLPSVSPIRELAIGGGKKGKRGERESSNSCNKIFIFTKDGQKRERGEKIERGEKTPNSPFLLSTVGRERKRGKGRRWAHLALVVAPLHRRMLSKEERGEKKEKKKRDIANTPYMGDGRADPN